MSPSHLPVVVRRHGGVAPLVIRHLAFDLTVLANWMAPAALSRLPGPSQSRRSPALLSCGLHGGEAQQTACRQEADPARPKTLPGAQVPSGPGHRAGKNPGARERPRCDLSRHTSRSSRRAHWKSLPTKETQ